MRKRITFTIDENVVKIFNEYTDEKCINRSRLVERLMTDWLKEPEKENA
jgi:metal-responsive CopG/Arc/MetJ family transcriptional regulator